MENPVSATNMTIPTEKNCTKRKKIFDFEVCMWSWGVRWEEGGGVRWEEEGACVMLTLYGSGLVGKQVMSNGKSNSSSPININVHLLIT